MKHYDIRQIVATKKVLAGRAACFFTLLLLFAFFAPGMISANSAATREYPPATGTGDRGGAVVFPKNAHASERLFGLPGLSNAGRVAPGILRGAQPRPEGYDTLWKMGIKTIINLRLAHSEKAVVEAAGMRSIEIPMDTMKKVDPVAVRKALSAMTDPGNLPVFIHCALGKDRTGVVVAVYRMEVEGWRESEAEAEMETFGFHEEWFHLKKFVRRYQEKSDRNRPGNVP